MKVLGIETSCDETAAAVVEDGKKLLSNVVLSSMDLHAAHGGVVPEIAARSHIEAIMPVITQALEHAADIVELLAEPDVQGILALRRRSGVRGPVAAKRLALLVLGGLAASAVALATVSTR